MINPLIYPDAMRRELISQIEGERILDFGVGTGYTTRRFVHAVGIDLSMKMLKKATDYQGQLVCADLLSAPFKGGCFDTVVSAGSFYYLVVIEQYIQIDGAGGVLVRSAAACQVLLHRTQYIEFKLPRRE